MPSSSSDLFEAHSLSSAVAWGKKNKQANETVAGCFGMMIEAEIKLAHLIDGMASCAGGWSI